MPRLTEQQMIDAQKKASKDIEESQVIIEKEDKEYQELLTKQQNKSTKTENGYYIKVINDNEYDQQMGRIKHDDSYELIIPFSGTVSSGHEIYIARNDKGILEQRVRRRDLNYQEERILKYPQIAEQLDMIYHDIDKWKKTIKEIKELHPKGEN